MSLNINASCERDELKDYSTIYNRQSFFERCAIDVLSNKGRLLRFFSFYLTETAQMTRLYMPWRQTTGSLLQRTSGF
jgi:hypothetical protein